MTRPRRLTERQTVKLLNAFDLEGRVADFLASFAPYVWENDGYQGLGYRWALLTPYGMVKVRVCPFYKDDLTTAGGDWIHCILDEYMRAGPRVQFARRSYHWKWNTHAFVGPCHRITDPAEVTDRLEAALETFKRGVRALFDYRND